MSRRRSLSFVLSFALLGLTVIPASFAQSTTHRGRKYKSAAPTSRVEVTILRNEDSKPIENASVIFHIEGDKGNMELKTNEDGKTMIDVLPTGSKILIQVIAKGYQTYGGDYQLDKDQLAYEIKLKRPGQQYSIYDNHPEAANSAKPAPKDDSSDEKSAAPKSSDSKPGASQPQPQ